MKIIAASALHHRPDGTIIDVRTNAEHKESRIALPHVHVPLDQLDPATFMQKHNLAADTPLYLLCGSGRRASIAAERFVAAGFHNVHLIEGGMISCKECGLTAQSKGVMSLERQVRIAAGSLVLLATALGFILTPEWHLAAGAIGAGLVFAGITDWCGMGLLLAKAPWNK
ncbi:MAG: rhodanese-like domain-containing protein [Bdellovibrionales bacterium]